MRIKTKLITLLVASIVALAAVQVVAAPASLRDAAAAYVRADYAVAAQTYRLLAVQGDATAQFMLGSMYYNGQGVPQDYVRAHMWFNLSAAQGNEKAMKDRIAGVHLEELRPR